MGFYQSSDNKVGDPVSDSDIFPCNICGSDLTIVFGAFRIFPLHLFRACSDDRNQLFVSVDSGKIKAHT